MKVVFIYTDGRRVYETIATLGGHSFDMGDFMRKCQKHHGAIKCEPSKRGEKVFYIIRCKGLGSGDWVRTCNGMWTSYETHRSRPYAELLMIDTMDEAQARVDEIAERMGEQMPMWELSIEEYGE